MPLTRASNMREYPCDLCGSWEAQELSFVREYTNGQPIHVCSSCGFVFVKHRRSPEEVAAAWNEIFQEHFEGERYTARIPAVKARHVYVAEYVDVHLGWKGRSVLDIGAGEGDFLKLLRDDYGASVFGIEPSPANCNKMREEGIPCFCGTVERFSESSENPSGFDVVTILWTLENCSSLHNMLEGARRALRPSGALVVATGSRILVPFKKTLRDYLGPNPADTHCFRFSANSLRAVLALHAFRTTHINRYYDSDILCVLGEKRPEGEELPIPRDDPREVVDFFARWHEETKRYPTRWP